MTGQIERTLISSQKCFGQRAPFRADNGAGVDGCAARTSPLWFPKQTGYCQLQPRRDLCRFVQDDGFPWMTPSGCSVGGGNGFGQFFIQNDARCGCGNNKTALRPFRECSCGTSCPVISSFCVSARFGRRVLQSVEMNCRALRTEQFSSSAVSAAPVSAICRQWIAAREFRLSCNLPATTATRNNVRNFVSFTRTACRMQRLFSPNCEALTTGAIQGFKISTAKTKRLKADCLEPLEESWIAYCKM